MDDLIRFARAAAADVDLQAQIQASTTADQIVALAAARGYTFNTADLRDYSRNLGAPFWPWADRVDSERRRFFDSGESNPPGSGRPLGWFRRRR